MSSFSMLATNHWRQTNAGTVYAVDTNGALFSLLGLCDASDATIRQDLPMTPFSEAPNLNSIDFPNWAGVATTVPMFGDRFAIQIPMGVDSLTYRLTTTMKPDAPIHSMVGWLSWVTDLAVTKQVPDKVYMSFVSAEYMSTMQEITVPPSATSSGTGVRWLMPACVLFNVALTNVTLTKSKLSITRVLRA